ncbi:MAG: DUF3783 domain-containing protein [Solobacterium sp.]|nr:DUF3783 domain-containing protein [Solobacterium sp.]
MKKIVFYLDETVYQQYQPIVEAKGFLVALVGDESLFRSVKEVFETDVKASGHEAFDEGYMLMQEISDTELTVLLEIFEEKGLEFEGIKVMRTEHNEKWTLQELLFETNKEHQVMKKAILLETLMKSTNGMDFNALPKEVETGLKQALMHAYMLLSSGQFDADSLENALQELSEQLKKAKRVTH